MKKGTHKSTGGVVAVKIIEKSAASEELTLLQRYYLAMIVSADTSVRSI